MKVSRTGLASVVVALAALSHGCSMGEQSPEGRLFLLGVAAESSADEAARGDASVSVRPARVVPPFGDRHFIYRLGESEYKADPYNGFIATPSVMVTSATIEWLRDRSSFRTVCGDGVECDASFSLQQSVDAMYAEFLPGRTRAVVRIRYVLTDDRASPPRIMLDREYERGAELADGRPETVAAGLNQAFAAVLEAAVDDLDAVATALP